MKTSLFTLENARGDLGSDAWSKLVPIYSKFINSWLRQCGIADNDIPDLTQDVMVGLVKKLPDFNHNGRTGAFRSWLKSITINNCRRYWDSKRKMLPMSGNQAATTFIDQLADGNSELSQQWDREHDQQVLQGILQMIRGEFNKPTLDAFWRVAIQGEPAKAIAQDLKISVGQVYKFKFRVMRRLEEEAQVFLDTCDDLLSKR